MCRKLYILDIDSQYIIVYTVLINQVQHKQKELKK